MAVPVIESQEKASGFASATLACSKPSGVVTGDLLLLICGNDADNTTQNFTDDKNGWDLIGWTGSGLPDSHIGVYRRIADETEGASETVIAASVRDWTMFYVRISGVDTTTPINISAFNLSGPSANHGIPSVTTDEDDCLVIYALSFDGGDGYPFSVSGTGFSQDDQIQVDTQLGTNSACWGHRELSSQGASGIATVTCSVSDGASFCQIAINADAGGGSTLLPINENGYGSDSVSVTVSAAVSDAGAGADNFGEMSADVPVTDISQGVDSVSPVISLSVSDVGSAIDSVSQILNSLLVQDTGSSIDTISQVLASLAISDTGAGSDGISLLTDILKSITDTGLGSDSINVPTVSLSVSDSGVAVDLISSIAAALSIADDGAASDLINTIKTQLIQVSDTGSGSDVVSMTVSLTLNDVASAVDAVGQVLNSLSVSDAGSGSETVIATDFDLLPNGKVTLSFSIKVPGAGFSMKTPGVDFTIK